MTYAKALFTKMRLFILGLLYLKTFLSPEDTELSGNSQKKAKLRGKKVKSHNFVS